MAEATGQPARGTTEDRAPGTADESGRPHIRQMLYGGEASQARRYMDVLGVDGPGALLVHELLTGLLGPLPGALGLLLRRLFYPLLFDRVGRGVVFGRNLVIRHGGRIRLGDGVVLDDDVLLDGRHPDGIEIGDRVVVNRGTALHAKDGPIRIGARSDIGAGSTLNSPGTLEVGRMVSLGGGCQLGGRSRTLPPAADAGAESGPDEPADRGQGRYSRGGVRVGDRCQLGGGVHVLDGARLGAECVVGAGLVVRESVPDRHVLVPRERPVAVPRELFRTPSPGGGPAEERPAIADGPAGGPRRGPERATTEGAPVADDPQERAERAVRAALERLNQGLPHDRRAPLEPDAPLTEPAGPLDSLGVVNLVIALEETAESEFGRPVQLVDAARVAEGKVPFSTPRSLARHLRRVLEEE